MARGRLAANLTLEMHLRDNDNMYPETVAVSLSFPCLCKACIESRKLNCRGGCWELIGDRDHDVLSLDHSKSLVNM